MLLQFWLAICMTLLASAETITGTNSYVEIQIGNFNILLSATHGGTLKPSEIPDRTSDELDNLAGDTNTKQMANGISDELKVLFLANKGIQVAPYVVINNLHRFVYLDHISIKRLFCLRYFMK